MSGSIGDNVFRASGVIAAAAAGRTGTVDWDTTPKTSTFTAVTANGYFLNTTSGVLTVNLPAGVAGSIVSMADYAGTWQTNNVTVAPNGAEKIGSIAADAILSTEGQSVTFVYVDSTQGWLNTMDSTSNVRGVPPFVAATGGTITTVCTNYKVHKFTGPGTFTVTSAGTPAGSNTVDYLVVAGGGSGASSDGGGGGAGGYRIAASTAPSSPAYAAPPLANPAGVPVSATPYAITVGAGAAGTATSPCSVAGTKGSNSVFHTITSTGGGFGSNQPGVGGPGGSGGGSANNPTGGTGNDPPVSPAQGFNGGASPTGSGGGGARGAGAGCTSGGAGSAGGAGDANDIASTGSPVTYSVGGNGDTSPTPAYNTPQPNNSGNGSFGLCAGGVATANGGSGIVIIRYKFQ